MGKYTSLARKFRDDGPQGEVPTSSTTILNVNINSMDSNEDRLVSKPILNRPEDTVQASLPVEKLQTRASGGETAASEHTTKLRSTNLTNLTNATNLIGGAERCMHGTAPSRCAVCNGYARWLIAGGDARIREAQQNPEAARRRYWRVIEGGAS